MKLRPFRPRKARVAIVGENRITARKPSPSLAGGGGAVTYHSLFSEVDPNCGDEFGVELPVRVLVEEAGFSHARVAQR